MTDTELLNLISTIRESKAEFQTVEVKRAQTAAPDKLYDTLSSFSNQNAGGTIVFGLYEKENFSITGVSDVQALQKKVMEQCNQMEPPVRAVFTCVEIDGKYVVSAEIPPIDISERPCFNKARGRINSSYVRVGDADIPMTEYEIYSYEAYRKKYQDDIRITERADMSSLDNNKLGGYLLRLKENKPNLSQLSDSQIMELMCITREGKPTLSAEMLFGIYPQAFYQQLGIIATATQGTEYCEPQSDGARFSDNKRIEGTIPEMLDSALSFVRANTRIRTVIGDDGKRNDIPDYPMIAVRETVLNALVHRDYSIHTEGMPIQLRIFSDRLEISNPGGLYGRLSIDMLGNAQPDTRNPVLANALEVLRITENRYSGIPTIRREMKQAHHPDPEFTALHGEFTVCLRNAVIKEDNKNVAASGLLNFCVTPRSKKEIAEYLGMASVSYCIKRYVDPLVEDGALALTEPKSKRSHTQKYFTVK